jgi:hypothetical protein
MLKHLAAFLQKRGKAIRAAGQEDLAEFLDYMETRHKEKLKDSTSK